ncbi:MAG: hypothetical protein Q9197_001337 [Variospora fuerteventurae]
MDSWHTDTVLQQLTRLQIPPEPVRRLQRRRDSSRDRRTARATSRRSHALNRRQDSVGSQSRPHGDDRLPLERRDANARRPTQQPSPKRLQALLPAELPDEVQGDYMAEHLVTVHEARTVRSGGNRLPRNSKYANASYLTQQSSSPIDFHAGHCGNSSDEEQGEPIAELFEDEQRVYTTDPSDEEHEDYVEHKVQSLVRRSGRLPQQCLYPEKANAEHLPQLSTKTKSRAVHLLEPPYEMQVRVIEHKVQSPPQEEDDGLRQDLGDDNERRCWGQLSLEIIPRFPVLPVELQERIIDHLPKKHRHRYAASEEKAAIRSCVGLEYLEDIDTKAYLPTPYAEGTISALSGCRDWFLKHPYLQAHVRHFEVWIPVWETKAPRRATEIPPIPSAFTPRPDMRGARVNGQTPIVSEDISDMTQGFQQSTQNATLEDIFELTRDLFPELYALTLEGGQGKRTPAVRVCRQRLIANEMAVNNHIGSLALKGAWNIVREPSIFYLLSKALPNLREYHCTYAKPKPQAYETMCCVLRCLPPPINHLNICLEGLTSKAGFSPKKWHHFYSRCHFCYEAGRILPCLESFSYTGRICAGMFTTACEAAQDLRDKSRLRSVDLAVRNCCRPGAYPGSDADATGIYQPDFIAAFTRLVVEAVRALIVFTSINYMRIRFLDLDSRGPLLNPYFHFQGSSVKGIYNSEITSLLHAARPHAEYDDPDMGGEDWGLYGDRLGTRYVDHLLTVGRPQSINVDAYAALMFEQRM